MKKQILIEQITEKPEGNFDLVLSGDAHQMEEDLELLLGEENGRWTCECFFGLRLPALG